MNNYKELKVWKRAVNLSTEVYKITNTFPKSEIYGITSQINRSVISIAANIAEGAGRNSNKEFNHFLGISLGSSFELDTLLYIAKNLNYINDSILKKVSDEITEIQKMTRGFQKSLNKSI
ncbi:MAG: four helix bundle protein [Bacteroidales bacterium]|jgi:four helix bundle protein